MPEFKIKYHGDRPGTSTAIITARSSAEAVIALRRECKDLGFQPRIVTTKINKTSDAETGNGQV